MRIDVEDLESRAGFQVYLRTIGRELQNEMGGQSRWGGADTYGQTRKPPGKESTMTKVEGSTREGHFGEIIGLVIEARIALNVEKNLITKMVMTEIGILLITRVPSPQPSKLDGG